MPRDEKTWRKITPPAIQEVIDGSNDLYSDFMAKHGYYGHVPTRKELSRLSDEHLLRVRRDVEAVIAERNTYLRGPDDGQ